MVSFTPPGWAADAVRAIGAGEPLRAVHPVLLLLAFGAACVVFGHKLSVREALRPPESGAARIRRGRSAGWRLPIGSDAFSAVLEKEAKTVLRVGWLQIVLVPIGFLVLRVFLLDPGGASWVDRRPLLFAGTALWLERRNLQPFAVGAAASFVLYVLLTTPYEMGQDISYNAPGLAILQQGNRYLGLNPSQAKAGLVALLCLSVAVLLVRRVRWLAAAVAAGVLVWGFTGELSFASASNRASDRFVDNIRRPFTWVDDATGGKPALYLGQQMADPNGEWLLEFWNPHSMIGRVWSLDGTAPGPGPTLTPDPRLPDGALSHDPHYPYVVEEQGMNVVGRVVTTHEHVAGGSLQNWRLVQVTPPLRLRDFVSGQYADGWSGASSAYTRFASGDRPGRVRIVVARPWGGKDVPGRVTVRLGPIVIGDDNQPHVGTPTVVKSFVLHKNGRKTLVLPAPGRHFRVEVNVTPTFRPHELSPQTESDNRDLGAKITYVYLPHRRS